MLKGSITFVHARSHLPKNFEQYCQDTTKVFIVFSEKLAVWYGAQFLYEYCNAIQAPIAIEPIIHIKNHLGLLWEGVSNNISIFCVGSNRPLYVENCSIYRTLVSCYTQQALKVSVQSRKFITPRIIAL